MPVTFNFLHSYPQTEVASLIRDRLARCRGAEIVSGFVTPDGVEALRASTAGGRINRFVLGAGTFRAFEALDNLIGSGLAPGFVRVHLGHTRATGGRKHPFARYRPMLHSKIYFFEMPDGTSSAFVGSHNMTGFALRGLNGEAGVLLEGTSSDPVFAEIRAHLTESFRQAVPYDPSLKEAYARWLRDYLDELGTDATDMPRDDEGKRTVILFASLPTGHMPQPGQTIYFELDKRLTEIKAIETEVHLHLFHTIASTPIEALAHSRLSNAALVGRVEAIDATGGSAEQDADWFIDLSGKPELKPTIRPFRPVSNGGKQQVRARISGKLSTRFDYQFDAGQGTWTPILGEKFLLDERQEAWSPVVGFRAAGQDEQPSQLFFSTLRELSPTSGSFILFSRRRRNLGPR